MAFGFQAPALLAVEIAGSFSVQAADFLSQQINRELLSGATLFIWLATWLLYVTGSLSPSDHQPAYVPPQERKPTPFRGIYGDAGPATYQEAHDALSTKATAFGPLFRD